MFRPYRNRQNWRAVLSPAQLEIALKANQLLSRGKFEEAAPLFANLAQDLENTQHPRRAANLHAQAAHAYADAQNEASSLAQARKALALFIQYQMLERTPRFYANITRKLVQRGMPGAAEALHKEYGTVVSPLLVTQPLEASGRRGSLPPTCTQCGAPLRSDEIDWVDDQTVECGYCGALIKTIKP